MSHEINPYSLKECPFDPNHKIAAHKLHAHIVKCKKSHPELERLFEQCPFNAVHLFHPSDREIHLQTCIDKHRILSRRPIENKTCDVSVPLYENRFNDADDEDWDNDTDIEILKPKIENKRVNVSEGFIKHESREDNKCLQTSDNTDRELFEKRNISISSASERSFIYDNSKKPPSFGRGLLFKNQKESKRLKTNDK